MTLSFKPCWLKRMCLALILLLTGVLSAYRKDLIFSYLGVKEGLSQSSVNSILKDRNGFMWFGTIDGLNRYDGLSFTIFHYEVDNPESLSSSSISCLFEDSLGRLWIGTSDAGLNRLERGVSRFYHYRHNSNDQSSIGSDSVSAICQDQRGNLWVATDQGLDCLVAGSERFVHYQPDPKDPGSIASRSIDFVLADRDGRIWIGLREMGVDFYNPDTGRFVHYRHDPKNDQTLVSDVVMNPCLAPDGMIWIGHDKGRLSRLDPKTGKVHRYILDEELPRISSLSADRNGNIWAGTMKGIFFLNTATGEMINIRSNPRLPATLSDDFVNSIYVDDSDILWAGLSIYGLNKCNLKAKRFINYTHDPTNPDTLGFDFCRAIYENRDGAIYVGGIGILDRCDPKTQIWKHFVVEMPKSMAAPSSSSLPSFMGNQNPTVYCIHPNSDNARDFLWLGTESGGLYTFDQVRQVIRHYPIADLRGRMVYGIYKDKEGFLWISTNEGLNHYDPKKKVNQYIDLRQVAGLDAKSGRTVDVNLVVPDRYGILWIGSTEDGLFSYDPRTNMWQHFSHDPQNPRSLSHNRIPTILETRRGELWIGTYGGGLNRFDRKSGTFEHFTTRRGLPNDVVYGILEDDEGQLWISCNLGLCRFNPSTGTFRSYTDKDGLIVNEFNSKSYHKSRWSGRLYFGGIKGVTAFFQKEVLDDPHPPAVVLEDLKIFNRSVVPGPRSVLKKPISETDSISLSYRDSMLTFEFNGLHYVAPSKNRFAYFLEGFDRQWNQTDAQRRYATYTNLNPGHYTLRVKAANCDGIWNETGKTLKIYIAPPFWKTWWFTLLSIVFTIVMLFVIYHYRVRGLQKRKAELEKLVDLRTQELKEMSLSDPMTNLRNRRYVSEVVMDEINSYLEQWKYVIKKGQRRKTVLPQSVIGLLLIDVDYFKMVNDRYGHKAGDLFLGEFASILRKNVRRDDIVVRWGGEEFLLILRNCDPAFLAMIAEKIRKEVEGNEFLISETEGLRVKRSCCIGIARFPFVESVPDLISFDHTIMLADMAMYLGKESGRNRTIYLEHSGLIPDKENVQKYFYPLETLKKSGFIRIHTFS